MGISLMIKQTKNIPIQIRRNHFNESHFIQFKKKKTNTHSHGKHIQHKNSKEKKCFQQTQDPLTCDPVSIFLSSSP